MTISINIEQIMDRLDEAEARAEAIENRADEVISDLIDSHRNMEVRAEAAERERDALAEKLADKCHDLYPNTGSEDWWWKEEWLEWARQQARGGENE